MIPRLRGAPLAPQILQATALDRRIGITWEAPEFDGGADIVKYVVRLQPVASSTPPPEAKSVLAYEPMRAVFEGLTNGVAYEPSVVAINAVSCDVAALCWYEVLIQASPRAGWAGTCGLPCSTRGRRFGFRTRQ